MLSVQRPERAGTSRRRSGLPLEDPERNKERSHRVARFAPDTGTGRGPYHGLRDLRHDAPLDPPTSGTEKESYS